MMPPQISILETDNSAPGATAAEKRDMERWVFAVTLILVFIMAARTPLDSDLWWHLRSGEVTWTSRQILLTDVFSYTRAGAAWVNHSWLGQVVLYGLYRVGSYLAISACVAGVATLALGLLARTMEGPAILRSFLLVLATSVAALAWPARPQIFSFLLIALVGSILYRYKWEQVDRLSWLIPIFILWSNLHGGYVLGLLWIGMVIAGELLNHLLGYTGEEILSFQKIFRLAFFGLIAGFAVLLNPNGIQTWLIPFQTVGVNALQNLISEWASPDFHQFVQLPFLAVIILTIFCIGTSGRRLDGSDFTLLAGFMALGLVARRNFGPFALAAIPVLSRHLWPAIQLWVSRVQPILQEYGLLRKISWSRPTSNRPAVKRWVNLGVLLFLGISAAIKVVGVSLPGVVERYENEIFPAKAVTWVQEHHPQGTLFNSYDWGGYLIWRLRDYPVFVDGRTDLYNDEIISQWIQVMNARPGWEHVLDRWGVHLVMVPPDWPINSILPRSGWSVLYQDQQAVVYGR